MLGKSLELNCLSGDPVFHIPGSHVSGLAHPNVLEQFSECHGQATSCAQCVLLVNVLDVDLEKEKLNEWLRVRKALQHRVHKARVTQVLETSQATLNFRVIVFKEFF